MSRFLLVRNVFSTMGSWSNRGPSVHKLGAFLQGSWKTTRQCEICIHPIKANHGSLHQHWPLEILTLKRCVLFGIN